MSVVGKMRVFSFKMFAADAERWRRLSTSPFAETGLGSVIRTMLEFASKIARPAPLDFDRLVVEEGDLWELAAYNERRFRGPGKESAEKNGITVTTEPGAGDVGAELPQPAEEVAKAKKPRARPKPKAKPSQARPSANGKAKAKPSPAKKKP